jgi:hypothetical protein
MYRGFIAALSGETPDKANGRPRADDPPLIAIDVRFRGKADIH